MLVFMVGQYGVEPLHLGQIYETCLYGLSGPGHAYEDIDLSGVYFFDVLKARKHYAIHVRKLSLSNMLHILVEPERKKFDHFDRILAMLSEHSDIDTYVNKNETAPIDETNER